MPLTPEEIERLDAQDAEEERRASAARRAKYPAYVPDSGLLTFERVGTGDLEASLAQLARALGVDYRPPPPRAIIDRDADRFSRIRREKGYIWYGDDIREARRVSEPLLRGHPDPSRPVMHPVYEESPAQREARRLDDSRKSLARLEEEAKSPAENSWPKASDQLKKILRDKDDRT